MGVLKSRIAMVTTMATVLCIAFTVSIPTLCLSAMNMHIPLLVVSIVILSVSAVMLPLVWIRFARLVSLKGVTAAIDCERIYDVSEIAAHLSISQRKVARRVRRILRWHVLRDYFFDGKFVHPTYRLGTPHILTCRVCGQSYSEDANGDTCPHCQGSEQD